MNKTKTRTLTLAAMFAALAYLVMLIGRLPIMPTLSFLKYDPKDVIIAVAGFLLGPLQGLAITAAVSLLEMITVSETGFIGLAMNILSTGAFMLPAAGIYRRNRSMRGAVTGLILGVVCMAVVMLAWNYIITPLYMHAPRETVAGMLLPVFLPFNLLKGTLNAAITMLLYKPLVQSLRSLRLVPEDKLRPDKGRSFSIWVTLVCVFVIATVIVCFRLIGK
ncbi:MAG: ECF transporter S component [Clostridia bacterium]|nr:ECF transporter S component [Clostridia bacterium]